MLHHCMSHSVSRITESTGSSCPLTASYLPSSRRLRNKRYFGFDPLTPFDQPVWLNGPTCWLLGVVLGVLVVANIVVLVLKRQNEIHLFNLVEKTNEEQR